jgi:hypothetical protein
MRHHMTFRMSNSSDSLMPQCASSNLIDVGGRTEVQEKRQVVGAYRYNADILQT